MSLPALSAVRAAAARIGPFIRRTRVVPSRALSEIVGAEVFLKLENEQETGSFKLRGATNVIAGLTAEARGRGVVASSAGNHGLGVALASRRTGTRAKVFVPRTAARVKVDGIRAMGADVDASQPNYDAAQAAAMRFAAETGAVFINPCAGSDLLAGQGTVALEVMEDCPDLQTFVLSVGGAGLLAGCGAVLRAMKPGVKIIGAQSENTAAMARSLDAGRRVDIEDVPTIAEGLAGQIDEDAFEIGRVALDRMALVTEEEIGRAILWLLDNEGVRSEGAAAVGVAAILSGRLRPAGKTVVVVSGGNIDDERIAAIRATAASRG